MNFFVLSLIKTALVAAVLLTTLAYLQWIERKVLAHIQLRPGPYRVGPHGLLQPLADVIKLVIKEGVIPANANLFFYLLAPILAVSLALTSISVIPFGPQVEVFGIKTNMELAGLDVGVLFVLAVSSLGVYGIAIGGWASNSKYSLMGGLRSSAQMVSYELPMALAIVSPLLLANSLSFREIVDAQAGFWFGIIPKWNVFAGPFPQLLSFVIFLIAAFAETNRIPFDLPEAEAELVAGFHTEYSSMGFASFFMAEYANILTVCCVASLLFLGGWQPLWPSASGSDFVPPALFAGAGLMLLFHAAQAIRARKWDRFSFPVFGVLFLALAALFLVPALKPVLVPLFWFVAKVGILVFVFIWVRGTLPRFRYDQLMRFAWTALFPLAVLNLLITGLIVALAS
ncbi:MAG: NADH-quinone oxidoreductase subunit H [Candidatus Solibacter usitatus]|nr:NADH-quinone oxidoreductase subunit H [Candidatus Solibacter usitatus]